MSSESQNTHALIPEELMQELRQFNRLGVSFFRVAAARVGMAVTDIQIMDLLDRGGPATAGQLAEFTGLTAGAITRILDRLEENRLVHRERDPTDGRKVIVRIDESKDDMHKVRSILDSVGKAWDEVASRYDHEQIAFLINFLKDSNAISRKELARLQEAPLSEGKIFSAPLEGQESSRLVVACGISRLSLSGGERIVELYQARFEGPIPQVKTKEGTVAIRYPRRLLGQSEKQGTAEILLSRAIPWRVVIQGGAAEITAELSSLNLAGLEITGGFSIIQLDLPTPSGTSPIRIRGGASEVTIRRPASVAVRVNLKGWVSELVFDGQTFGGIGNNGWLQSPGFDPTVPYYTIEITSYANMVTITSN